MKYNIVFKFLAVALCALMLLGAAGSAAAFIGMTESGLYDISGFTACSTRRWRATC